MADGFDFSKYGAPQEGYPTRDEVSALLDRKFGKGAWRITSGYRTEEQEDELRAEGAGSVPKGHTSPHTLGTAARPGAWDIVVDGVDPAIVADKLYGSTLPSGASLVTDYPEGAHGTQGAHLHVRFSQERLADAGEEAPPPPPAKEVAFDFSKYDASPKAKGGAIRDAASPQSALERLQRPNVLGFAPAGDIKDEYRRNQEAAAAANKEYVEKSRKGDFLGAGLAYTKEALSQLGELTSPFSAISEPIARGIYSLPDKGPVSDTARLLANISSPAGMIAEPIIRKTFHLPDRAAKPLSKEQRAEQAEMSGNLVTALIPFEEALGLGRAIGAAPRNALRAAVRPPELTAQAKAESILAKRLARDQGGRAPTAQEMLDHAMRTPQKNLTLMDVAGPRTRGLAGSIARSPTGHGGTQIESFLRERSEMQGPRLEGDVQQHVAAGSSRQTIDSLRKAQKEASEPLYEDAFEANPVVRSSVVDQLVRSKQGESAWREAQDRAKGWVAGTDKPIPDKYSLRTLDQMKQVFDDRISMARRQGDNGTAALYKGLKDRLVEALDEADHMKTGGLYAKARKTFSDSAQSKAAVEFGREAMGMTPEAIKERLASMSAGDRELAKLGVAENLRSKIEGTDIGRNAAVKLARNRAFQARLEPFFDSPRKLQKFLDSAVAEDTMFRTQNDVLGGSKTAGRLAEDEGREGKAAFEQAMSAGQHLLHGKPFSAAAVGAKALFDSFGRPRPEVAEHLAKILTEPLSANGLARQMLERSSMRHVPVAARRTVPRLPPPHTAPRNALAAVLAAKAIPRQQSAQ